MRPSSLRLIVSALIPALLLVACANHERRKTEYAVDGELSIAAMETYARFSRGVHMEGSREFAVIHESLWAPKIRDLAPIKVYVHRDNVVVVQRVRGNVEEGQYLYNPISSFMPRSGVDGFEFFGTSKDGATDFRRTVGAPTR